MAAKGPNINPNASATNDFNPPLTFHHLKISDKSVSIKRREAEKNVTGRNFFTTDFGRKNKLPQLIRTIQIRKRIIDIGFYLHFEIFLNMKSFLVFFYITILFSVESRIWRLKSEKSLAKGMEQRKIKNPSLINDGLAVRTGDIS